MFLSTSITSVARATLIICNSSMIKSLKMLKNKGNQVRQNIVFMTVIHVCSLYTFLVARNALVIVASNIFF